MDWTTQRIIITGGSSGIGANLVATLAKQGAKVVFCGKEITQVQLIATQYDILDITVDLTKEAQLRDFFEQAITHLGGVDVLINNAGYVIAEPFEQLTRADFEHMYAINAIAPAQLAQLAMPYFKQQQRGDIVNVGATGAYYAFDKGSAYASSKAALSIISKNLNLEFRKDNIRTFHIDPSWCTDTNNNNYGTPIPKDEKKLNPTDISTIILAALEMNRRALIPQMSIWGTQP